MPMSTPRRIATIIAALCAAACFALAVQGGRWWTVGEHAIGTVSSDRCFDGNCERTTLGWTGGGDIWVRAGVATLAAGMVSALALIALAGSLAARSAGRLAASVSVIAVMTAIVAGAVFQQYRPSVYGIAIGRGTFLFGAAIVLGLASAIATLRAPRNT